MTPALAFSYPTRSTLHHECAGARDLADWLAHLRLKNRADRTLDDYERTIAALLLWRDKPVAEYTLEDLEHFILLKYGATPGARVRMSHLKGFFDYLYNRDRAPKNIGARLEIRPRTFGSEPARLQAEPLRKGAERTRTAVLHVRFDLGGSCR